MSRRSIEEVAAVVQSLACTGLPFRDHTENFALRHSGNFIMALKPIAEFAYILAELQKMEIQVEVIPHTCLRLHMNSSSN
jgi:hypothetical protein